MVAIFVAFITGLFTLFAALITVNSNRLNQVRDFNQHLGEYEEKYYRKSTMREVVRDRAAENLFNLKGVKAKIVDLYFYDTDLKNKVYLVTKFRSYFEVNENISHININKKKLNVFSFLYFMGYLICCSFVMYQFIDFNQTISKFNTLLSNGKLINIFNWITWHSLIFIAGLFCLVMFLRIQDIRNFDKTDKYKILF